MLWPKRSEWAEVRQAVKTMNHELGQVQRDMEWVKWLLRGLVLAIVGSNTAILLKLLEVW